MAFHQKVRRFHRISLVLPVMCLLLQKTAGQNNLALGRRAAQSTNWANDGGGASKAVDGKVTAAFSKKWCSRTKDDGSWQWWSVNLWAVHTIKSVRITSSNDCCPTNLRNFSVEVSVEDPTTLPGFPGPTNAAICVTVNGVVPVPGGIGYACDKPVTGRYVRLVKLDLNSGPLVMCEFEVFKTNVLTEQPNLAFKKPAYQSSTSESHVAGFAVDGNKFHKMTKGGTCTLTEQSDLTPWWMVDLENVYLIESISFTNRVHISEGLSDFTVEISVEAPDNLAGYPNKTTAPVCIQREKKLPEFGSILFLCQRPLIGRYVRVVKVGLPPLSICDFEAFEKEPRLWRFDHVASQGDGKVQRSTTAARRLVMDCARSLIRDKVRRETNPFLHVEFLNGKCRFLQSDGDASDSGSSNWTMYELV